MAMRGAAQFLLLALALRTSAVAGADDDDPDLADESDESETAASTEGDKEDRPKIEGPAIGIDLGTTFSCVAIFRESGSVEIIPNEQGNRITPSYVAFTKQGRLIGEAAKNEAALRPSQTIFDVKRIIGRKFDEETIQKDIANLPYRVIEQEGKAGIMVSALDEIKVMTPEQISAMVLTKMKETAETYLGEDISNAVITVPAYFNDAQRQATKDAAQIAGLNVLRLINEPTAAAIAYGLDKKDELTVLVYDLGGGTFDVSLLTVAEGVFQVVATSGDTHLGGEDFDQRVMQHFVTIFADKHGKNITEGEEGKKAMSKLRAAVENAKRGLSKDKEVTVEVESLYGGIDLSEKLTRAKFEDLNADLFRSTLGPMKKVLEDSRMQKSEIDEVVLVGGSTRIPKIRQLVEDFFGKQKNINVNLNPDEAIAHGAAVQAGILSGVADNKLLLLDVAPLSLGIETAGELFETIIARNSPVPTNQKREFVTSTRNAKATSIKVFEGERRMVKDNNLLGQFELSGFPNGFHIPHTVEFSLDKDGILTVSATIKDSGKSESLTISNEKGRLSSSEIARMVKEAEDFKEDDSKRSATAKSMNSLKEKIGDVEHELNGDNEKVKGKKEKMESEDIQKIEDALKEVRKWMSENSQADSNEIDEKKTEFSGICSPLLSKHTADTVEGNDDDDDDADLSEEDLDADLIEEDL